MDNISDIMRNVLNKCRIAIDGNVFSGETLMRSYAEFISQTVEKQKHNVGYILHPGSVCFDALIITYAAISNILFNQTNTADIVDSLNVGDVVLFGTNKKQRYIFEGKLDGEYFGRESRGKTYIKLRQDNGMISYEPENRWRLIEPYNGSAKRIDGRGMRRKITPKEDFYTSVLGMKATDIPSVIDTSTVLVMSKEKADSLIKSISIVFDGKTIDLLDLVTASYYTEDAEITYGGNPGKSEPVLKVCSKVSVARILVLSKGGNRHIGLIVLGQDVISRGESELPELVNRKSLQYVYLCSTIDTDCVNFLIDDEQVDVFACTKEFLMENAGGEINECNSLTDEMANKIRIVQEKVNAPVFLNIESFDTDSYKLFKKSLVTLKRNQYESDAKESFIVHSHSLMNLLLTAPFPLTLLDKYFDQGLIPVEPVKIKLGRIEKWAEELPISLKNDAQCVINTLQSLASVLLNGNSKEKWLVDYLKNNSKKRVVIVVPKAYYSTILKNSLVSLFSFKTNVSITTPGRFDGSVQYDTVIVLGNYEGKRFNAFRCISSREVISLLYVPEKIAYEYNKHKSSQSINMWNKRSTIKIENFKEDDLVEDVYSKEIIENEKEIDDYVQEHDLVIDSIKLKSISQSSRVNLTTEIIAVATFSDDSKAYFSKHYKAYVLDTDKEKVSEVSVPELSEGDAIIFTKNNGDTQDIVDSILKQMIEDGKINDEMVSEYNRSKEWKKGLISYMETNGYSSKEVAKQMLSIKVEVQEPTIIRWLDENTHTVGPKKEESIRAIGKLIGNSELVNNSNVYFEACRVVRKIRRQILNEVGNAIIRKLSGKPIPANSSFTEVYEKVDSLAKILQIDRLVQVEMELPLNVANRPVNM